MQIERGVYASDLNEHAVTRECLRLIQINDGCWMPTRQWKDES